MPSETTTMPITQAEAAIEPHKPSIESIIERAVADGRTEELESLLAVWERMQARQAKAAYDKAFAEFQAACPPIPRKRTADIATARGASYSYCYAALEDIDDVVIPILNHYGFSRSFGDAIITETTLTITCRLTHEQGHSEERAFTVPVTSRAGMSEQQKYGSAATYAKRQAVVNVAGLRVCDLDDDGAGEPPQKITTEQAQMLNDLIIQSASDKAKFCEWAGVETLADVDVPHFKEGVRMLQERIERQKQEGKA